MISNLDNTNNTMKMSASYLVGVYIISLSGTKQDMPHTITNIWDVNVSISEKIC